MLGIKALENKAKCAHSSIKILEKNPTLNCRIQLKRQKPQPTTTTKKSKQPSCRNNEKPPVSFCMWLLCKAPQGLPLTLGSPNAASCITYLHNQQQQV